MLICFCHMIKTAGTTLSYIFRNNYGFNYTVIGKRNFTPDDLKTLLRVNRSIKAISGHPLRSTMKLDSVCPNIKYITFLRDPIDRYISHYNHGRSRGYHQMSLEERLDLVGERNYQVKFIIGAQSLEEREFIVGVTELEEAKRILANDYAFVGLVEKFDESLILMKKLLNLQGFDLRYQRKNVTSKRIITRDEVPCSVMKKLREANEFDYELYKFCRNELFENQKHRYGDGFIEDLMNFELSNKNYKFNERQVFKYRIGRYLVYKPILSLRSFFA